MSKISLKNYPTAALLFALLFCITHLNGQSNFLIEANLGYTNAQYNNPDLKGYDNLRGDMRPTVGLLFGKEFDNQRLYAETGVEAIFYSITAPPNSLLNIGLPTRLLTTFHIPFQVYYRIPLVREKFFISPGIGYRLGITTGYNSNTQMSFVRDGRIFRPFTLTLQDFTRTFHMAEANLSFEYSINEKVSFQTTFKYAHSLSQLGEVVWMIAGNGSEPFTDGIQMDGSFAGITLGLRRYI